MTDRKACPKCGEPIALECWDANLCPECHAPVETLRELERIWPYKELIDQGLSNGCRTCSGLASALETLAAFTQRETI